MVSRLAHIASYLSNTPTVCHRIRRAHLAPFVLLLALSLPSITLAISSRSSKLTDVAPPAQSPVPIAEEVEPAARPVPPIPVKAGQVAEVFQDRDAGVTTLTLTNGVIVHYRAVRTDNPQAPAAPRPPAAADAARSPTRDRDVQTGTGRIVFTICIAGGEILESAANRGITAAAANSLDRLSVKSQRREDLEVFLKQSGARLSTRVTPDSLIIRLDGDLEAIEAGLRTVRLLLTEPAVTANDLDAWRTRIRARRESTGPFTGRRAVFDAVVDTVFAKDDLRPRRIADASLTNLTAPDTQSWIDSMLGLRPGSTAHPVEAAVAGDLSIQDAVRLATLYLGTLSDRPRLTPDTFADARRVARGVIPMSDIRTIEGMTHGAYIVAGFLGADLSDIHDHRALSVAAEVIEQRLKKWPVDERGENVRPARDGGPQGGGNGEGGGGGGGRGDGAGVQAVPGGAFPGFGFVLGVSEVPAHRAPDLLIKLESLFQAVRERGATEDEVRTVTTRLSAGARDLLKRPGYWSSTLASSIYHNLPIDEIAAAESRYAAITPSEIQTALAKYDTPERRIRIRLMPGSESK